MQDCEALLICISIHALLAESDLHCVGFTQRGRISIHALLAESDPGGIGGGQQHGQFLSTLSLRRATVTIPTLWESPTFLSTLSLRRATDRWLAGLKGTLFLSTLSLRRATMFVNLRVVDGSFLSTLSLRRATCYSLRYSAQDRHFYPRSPCGERPLPPHEQKRGNWISIHALLAESYGCATRWTWREEYFYPRSPCGERPIAFSSGVSSLYFYPRSPCGERQRGEFFKRKVNHHFYPRSPCGERLYNLVAGSQAKRISIHALLAESDVMTPGNAKKLSAFLSTLSLRRATSAKKRRWENRR